MPLGPIEVSTEWYAMARLAFSTTGFLVWATDRFEIWHLVSRVMSKQGAYIMAALRYILDTGGYARTYEQLSWWSDGATNLKNSTTLGTFGFELLPDYGWRKVVVQFGAPKHMKTRLDGEFGTLSRVKHMASLRTMITSVEELVTVYQRYFENEATIHGTDAKRHIVNFMPQERRHLSLTRFTRASCGGIRHSFCFSITRNDARRVTRDTLRARDPAMKWRNTGLDFRNHGCCNHIATDCVKRFPELAEEEEEMAADGDAPLMPADEEVPLLVDTREYNGWRCSYSRCEEDSDKMKRFHKHLSASMARLHLQLARVAAPQRHRLQGLQLRDANHRKATRKQRRANEETTHFRNLRGIAARAVEPLPAADED